MKIEDFTSLVKEKGNFDKVKDAENAIETVIECIKTVVGNSDTISFSGFGNFKQVSRKGREGKIPGKNTPYKSEDKKTAKFEPSKKFKKSLN